MAWYGMVWCGVVWCGMVWYGLVWYGPETSIESLDESQISGWP